MWLLDANLPLKLVEILRALGVESHTAESRGWKTLKNGELARTAFASGFVCILTKDKGFGEAAAKSLKQISEMSVVLLRLPQMREEIYFKAFEAAWEKSPIVPVPGKIIFWP